MPYKKPGPIALVVNSGLLTVTANGMAVTQELKEIRGGHEIEGVSYKKIQWNCSRWYS